MASVINGANGTDGLNGKGAAKNDRAERSDASPGGEAAPNMGSSVTPHVTPHVEITGDSEKGRFLACGVDSLDLSFYVEWGNLVDQWRKLTKGREDAQAADKPIFWRKTSLGDCLIYPTGKSGGYRFHLQVKDLHIFIGIGQCSDTYANVFVSLNAKTLWQDGVLDAVKKAETLITDLRGTVKQIKVSRCDLCADFLMPRGIQFDFLRNHGVPTNIMTAPIFKGWTLETYYIGSRKANIRARIYDKSKEILANRKSWFLDVWQIEACKNVWRVEFQLRRPAMKSYGIDTPQQLVDALGGMWQNLTHNWWSLRLRNSSNTTRRTFHPWWQAVQSCAEKFGPVVEIKRDLVSAGKAGAQYYLTRGANVLLNWAALVGYPDMQEALLEFTHAIEKFWDEEEFSQAYIEKNVSMGGPEPQEEEEDEIPF